MNSNYDTDDLELEHLQSPVSVIHLCGYKNEQNAGDDDGNPPTNHWAAFLQLSPNRSVRLDMSPGYGSDGQRGKIMVASKRYPLTNNASKTLAFRVNGIVSVQNIVDLINSKGRDRYKFTVEWEGCRFWVYTVTSDLEAAGIVPAGSAKATWDAVSLYWRHPTGSEPRPVKQGMFY